MDILIEKFRRKLALTPNEFQRSFMERVQWQSRLVAIRGARGVGKTTLLLQHIKSHLADSLDRVLYVSLDDLWFTDHSLIQLVDNFVKRGGGHLFLDEVHKTQDWSRTIKNIYDDYPDLHVVFTGSSLLEIMNARADLSRRAVVHTLQGLSFREYLNLKTGLNFQIHSLEEILRHHDTICPDIVTRIRPLQFFGEYLKSGYYPFFIEGLDSYPLRLEETVNMILDLELPQLRQVEMAYIPKLRQLLGVIAESAPFMPNISKLSDRIGINRQTLLAYLHHLQEARLIKALYKKVRGLSQLQKPDKLYLENTNLMVLFKGEKADVGSMRETFLANQLAVSHELHYAESGDFLVDRKVTIEVGGKDKGRKQLSGISDAYVAADDLEYGHDRKIPLWLFGFLY